MLIGGNVSGKGWAPSFLSLGSAGAGGGCHTGFEPDNDERGYELFRFGVVGRAPGRLRREDAASCGKGRMVITGSCEWNGGGEGWC